MSNELTQHLTRNTVSFALYLTFLRILIPPVFMILFLWHEAMGVGSKILPYFLLFIIGFAELTDACDGYFARKYNQVTDIGKILDPMADSIYRITVFLAFTQNPVNLSVGWVFIFLFRDLIVSSLRTICAFKGIALAARASGKLKSILQGIAVFSIVLLMIPYEEGHLSQTTLQTISSWIVGVVAVYTLLSGVEYLLTHRRIISHLLKPNANSEL